MLHVLRTEGIGQPAALLTTVNESANRVAMHAVRRDVLEAQAHAAGLPLIVIPIPHPCPNEVYEAQMSAAIARAKTEGFTHVAFGDLFLEDVRRYREERMEGTGLTPIFPLWLRPTDALAREMINGGLEAYLTCVDPRAVPPSLVGRRFDATLLSRVPRGRRSLRRARRVSHLRGRGTHVLEESRRASRRDGRAGRFRVW